MTVRPYKAADKEDVRFICLNSEGPCTEPEDFQRFILTTYCDYYLEHEPFNCFVAADDRDKAVGYVICTQDYDAFEKIFFTEYVPKLKSNRNFYRAASRSVDLQKEYKALYPAHLHIDLLPEYQRQGFGHKLVDRLCAQLQAKGVPGVMLTVGSMNRVGQSFYEKYGFTKPKEQAGDVAYGLML